MKDLFKKIAKPLLIFSLFLMISCEKDLYEDKVKQYHNTQTILLRGKDAEKAMQRLNAHLSHGNQIVSPSPYSKLINVNIGTISYDEVLMIIDEMGKENYSFKLEKPESGESKFYNVVLQEEDESSIIKIIEFAMNPEFAEQYKIDKNLMAFKGSIKFTPVYNDSPCPEPELIIEVGEIPNPTLGGGGGNNNNTDPQGNPIVTGNGGHGTGLSLLLTIINANNASGGSGNTTATDPFDTVGNIRCNPGCHYDPNTRNCVPDEKANKMTLRPDPIEGDPTAPPVDADPCAHITEIGILPPYDKCSQTFLRGLDNHGADSDAAYLYDHNADYAELMDYLNNNPNCNEANEFAVQMLRAMRENPDFHFDVKKSAKSPVNIDLTRIQDTTKAAKRLKCVYEKLINSPSFKNLFLSTFNSNDRLNVTLEVSDNIGDALGNCTLISTTANGITTYTNQIKIRKSILGDGDTKSNFIIAKTIIHEFLHAFLDIKAINCNNGATIPYLNNSRLEELITQYYQNFNCQPDAAGSPQSQHDFIYNHMIPTFESIFGEIRNDLAPQSQIAYAEQIVLSNPNSNFEENWNWNNFYKFLSLGGLHNCESFTTQIASSPDQLFLFNAYNTNGNHFIKECN